MDVSLPFVDITRPDGQHHLVVPLTKACMTIGRYPLPYNDIGLLPDQRYVSREKHCSLEHRGSTWEIVPSGKNATFLDRGEGLCQIQEKTPLADGNRIYLQGGDSETSRTDKPQFWVLLFRDPERTQTAYPSPYLEYSEKTPDILCRIVAGARTSIHLTPREQKLIAYMFKWNREHESSLPFIPIENLKQAIWEEQANSYDSNDLQKVIGSLRDKIEPGPDGPPQFLVNKPRYGYLLNTHLLPSVEKLNGERKSTSST